jgi:hypothetical protein
VTTSHGSRGGSTPPRPPAAGKPYQWFVFRPWVFGVTLAGMLLRATPRPPVPIPVTAWARAYGLARDPGSGRHAISLIGPGPDFSPQYAMITDPGEPVILATMADASGDLAGPLLIEGCYRSYKAAVTGRAEIPAVVLTAAETLLIRSDAVPGPSPRPGTVPRAPHRTRTTATEAIPGADRNHHETEHPARRRRAVARGNRAARPGLLHRHPGHDRRRRPGPADGGAHRSGRGRTGHARRLPRPGRGHPPC